MLNHALLSRMVKERSKRPVRFRAHRVPERRRLSHARRLPGTDYDGRIARDADAWLARLAALPKTTSRTSPPERGIKTRYATAHRGGPRSRRRAQAGRSKARGQLDAAVSRRCRQEFRRRRRPNIAARRSLSCATRSTAQRAFADFMAREYVPAARPALAWRSTSGGEASYRFLAAPHHHHGDDAGRDPQARAGRSCAHPRPDGRRSRRPASRQLPEFLKMLRTDPLLSATDRADGEG